MLGLFRREPTQAPLSDDRALPDDVEAAIRRHVQAMADQGNPSDPLAAAIVGAQLRSAAVAALHSTAPAEPPGRRRWRRPARPPGTPRGAR